MPKKNAFKVISDWKKGNPWLICRNENGKFEVACAVCSSHSLKPTKWKCFRDFHLYQKIDITSHSGSEVYKEAIVIESNKQSGSLQKYVKNPVDAMFSQKSPLVKCCLFQVKNEMAINKYARMVEFASCLGFDSGIAEDIHVSSEP